MFTRAVVEVGVRNPVIPPTYAHDSPNEELPLPHAVPVFESTPSALKVAQPGVPPALETMRLVELAVSAVIAVEDAYVRIELDAARDKEEPLSQISVEVEFAN